ncbi:MAG: FAD-dependent oxidoreductase [Acidimicrobiales bacterium]
MASVEHFRSRSFWLNSLEGDDLTPRPGLATDAQADVVGGGYTGLWTAYYLKRADSSLRITVLEAEIAGFGTSGRNGGWCSALLPMSLDAIAERAGLDGARRMAAMRGSAGPGPPIALPSTRRDWCVARLGSSRRRA